MDDLVYRDCLYYKKSSDVPFGGETNGQTQGTIKNGEKKALGLHTTLMVH